VDGDSTIAMGTASYVDGAGQPVLFPPTIKSYARTDANKGGAKYITEDAGDDLSSR